VYICAYTESWLSSGSRIKRQAKVAKHGGRFADAAFVFEDPLAVTVIDDESDPIEQRFVILGPTPPGGY
jgi:uncharacterized DUF497 family protein